MSTQTAVRTSVKTADLLKPISENIAKDYVVYTAKEASSVNLNSALKYEVVVAKCIET